MNRTFFVSALPLLGILVAGGYISTDVYARDADKKDHESHHQRFDPLQRAEKHLGELKIKLKLQDEQTAEWDSYANAVRARAKEKADRKHASHRRHDESGKNMDTATRMERMSTWMRERADSLAQMAKDTRNFQQVLTPEQQTTFDAYWKSHFGHGKKKHRRKSS